MLSRNRLKIFQSLQYKKYRNIHGKFLIEGEKTVKDILGFTQSIIRIESLLAAKDFLRNLDVKKLSSDIEIIEISDDELKRISTLATPNKAVLVCDKPDFVPDYGNISRTLSLYLEDIRDPGNLGTIIRTADWFGIDHIFCSKESVEVFNPKVIQSTMGAICRLKVYYEDHETVIRSLKYSEDYKIYGTVLDGENIYVQALSDTGLIILGNESRGISSALLERADIKITIPTYNNHEERSESLNIAAASSIIISEFRRRDHSKWKDIQNI